MRAARRRDSLDRRAFPTTTNELLVGPLHERGIRAQIATPAQLGRGALPGDVILGRLDVLPTLDGVEPGLSELRRAERWGIRVLNPAASLLASHDKLQTALRLAEIALPQPPTVHVDREMPRRRLDFPVVVKPRFGSGGREIALCESEAELGQCLRRLRDRAWFRRQGALVQTLVPHPGHDLRIVVAGGRVVGAIERVAPAGQWRTSIALESNLRRVSPPPEACTLAIAAAGAVEADLAGVDLLPRDTDDYVVLDVNGAVDFTADYSPAGSDIFEEVAAFVSGNAPEIHRTASIGG